MRILVILLAVCFAAVNGRYALAHEAETPSCPKTPGMLPYPAVPREQTAIAIFQAVVGEYQSPKEAARFEIIARREPNDPETWIVFQSITEFREGNQTIVTMGGGGFEMKIDRCTGGVRDFHRER